MISSIFQKDDEDDFGVDSDMEEEERGRTKLYCICRKPDMPGLFMVGCDSCDEWFHGECIGVTEQMASKLKKYVCNECKAEKKGNTI